MNRVGNGKANVSLTDVADAMKQESKQRSEYACIRMEKVAIIVRELRLAGMINKAGADRITHELVLGMSALESNRNEALPIEMIVNV